MPIQVDRENVGASEKARSRIRSLLIQCFHGDSVHFLERFNERLRMPKKNKILDRLPGAEIAAGVMIMPPTPNPYKSYYNRITGSADAYLS